MSQAKFFILLILAYSLMSCGGDSRYIPDVSKIDAPMEVQRFDRDFFAMDTANLAASMQQLYSKYPDFAPIFINHVLGGALVGDTLGNTRAFLAYPYSRKLYDTTQIVYANDASLQAEMSELAKFYRYYFPKDSTPIRRLYTFVSIYKYGIIVLDDAVAVGLDFFLGEQHADYQSVENLRHSYVRRTLTPAHLTAQIAYAIADDIIETQTKRSGHRLIDYMLHNGKKFYLTRLLAPRAADTLIYKFSELQLATYASDEAGLYEYLSKELNLYSDKLKDFRSHVMEGPFDRDLRLYGNSASWLGAQIVEQYAERVRREIEKTAKDVTAQGLDGLVLQRVLGEGDPQEFLKRYKPKR